MKKLLSLAAILLGIAAAGNTANAGVSVGISIGGHGHGFLPPLPPLPVIIGRPPVVVVAPPRIVVTDRCDTHGHYYRGQDRFCDYRPAPRYYHYGRRDDRHDHGYRHDDRRDDRHSGRDNGHGRR